LTLIGQLSGDRIDTRQRVRENASLFRGLRPQPCEAVVARFSGHRACPPGIFAAARGMIGFIARAFDRHPLGSIA
jgi:hypothetical protein